MQFNIRELYFLLLLIKYEVCWNANMFAFQISFHNCGLWAMPYISNMISELCSVLTAHWAVPCVPVLLAYVQLLASLEAGFSFHSSQLQKVGSPILTAVHISKLPALHSGFPVWQLQMYLKLVNYISRGHGSWFDIAQAQMTEACEILYRYSQLLTWRLFMESNIEIFSCFTDS